MAFEKFASAYLFQIAQEKSCDDLLIVRMQFGLNFLHSISTFCTVWDKCSQQVQRFACIIFINNVTKEQVTDAALGERNFPVNLNFLTTGIT